MKSVRELVNGFLVRFWLLFFRIVGKRRCFESQEMYLNISKRCISMKCEINHKIISVQLDRSVYRYYK